MLHSSNMPAEEQFDLLDEDGNKTGLTKGRKAVHRDGERRQQS